MRVVSWLAGILLLAVLATWWLARPQPLPAAAFAALAGDPASGERIFRAAGCASCHSAEGARGDDLLVLAGGRGFDTDFGVFRAPNISPDPEHGIGGWTLAAFGNAMLGGVSPDGGHYYPAFPYTSYARMTLADVADLKAYLDTLPPSRQPDEAHELAFPFDQRWALGLWKRLYLRDGWVMDQELDEAAGRGRYLVEALAHCGECHTPRDRFGGMDTARWLAGAPNPSGRGSIPNITPGGLTWSAEDIQAYLVSGFTPSFDVAGGTMAAVIEGLSRLPEQDIADIVAYLKAVPAVE
jgi:mono/diheme cytochrome c family protein